MDQHEKKHGLLAQFRQPYVASLGAGGFTFTTLLSLLMAAHDPKTAVVIAVGFAVAQLTKASASFSMGAPRTAVALYVCFAAGILASLSIVSVEAALAAMKENGLAMALSAVVGLYAALLGAAQDRPRD